MSKHRPIGMSLSGTGIILLAVSAVVLAIATYVEKTQGTAVAKENIYHSPLLFGLFVAMVLLFICDIKAGGRAYKKRIALCTVHIALAVMLLGACLTHFTGYEGTMHLREGEVSESVTLTNRGEQRRERLPFAIELTEFEITRYPGSRSPSDFKSTVRVITPSGATTHTISMNNVLDIDGYRFFQASYDTDECGTILMVNYDPWGKPVTYFGYAALFLGLLLSLCRPHSRIVRLIRRESVCLAFAILCSASASAQSPTALDAARRYAIPQEHAAAMGELPMQSPSGRIMPVNTFAREVMRKLSRQETIGELSPDQCMLGIVCCPELWAKVPLIYNDSKAIAQEYSLPEGRLAFTNFFDEEGAYILEKALERAYRKPKSQRDARDKSLIKLDERVNLFNQLAGGLMLNLFPLEGDPLCRWYSAADDLSSFAGKDSMFVSKIMLWYAEEVANSLSSGQWDTPQEIAGMISTYQQAKGKDIMPSAKKLKAELFYNSIDLLGYCRMAYLILGFVVFGFSCFRGLRKPIIHSSLPKVLLALTLLSIAVHATAIGLRTYISGYAPLSNSYETVVCLSLILALIGAVFLKRNMLAYALGTGMAGIMLFVSKLSRMDPQITPLVPVLKSPWLMIHVAVVMAAYGFFCLSALLGLANVALLCTKKHACQVADLTAINETSLWIGLILMTAGTFLGAIWANESWGRYWSWDPKETWALITIFTYTCVTHLHLLRLRHHQWYVNLLSLLALSSVIMTYWGVNYFLSGMHSYGGN